MEGRFVWLWAASACGRRLRDVEEILNIRLPDLQFTYSNNKKDAQKPHHFDRQLYPFCLFICQMVTWCSIATMNLTAWGRKISMW